MVCVDLTCVVIRLTPVWVCLIAYCPNGKRPTPLQALVRVMDYGFSVEAFKRKPIVLLTHMFVHANESHLAGNLTSLMATLLEFGGPSVQRNVEEHNVWVSVRRMVGSFAVFIGGGIMGGIGGQLMFNDAQLACRHKRWMSLLSVKGETNGTPLDAVIRRAKSWLERMKYKIDKKRTDSIFMCGASAGICSLAGFNVSYYKRWGTALTMVAPEVIALVCSLLSSQTRLANTAWLPAGEVVGHAAHVGGFTAGVCIGLAWRWFSRVYRNARQRRQRTKKV